MGKVKLSREEIAKQEIGHTTVTYRQKIVLCAVFFSIVAGYPLFQMVYEYRTRDIRSLTDFQVLTIFPRLADAIGSWYGSAQPSPLGLNRNLAQTIETYEDTLEDTSSLRAGLLSPIQTMLLTVLGTGNEKVIPGKGGFLFYTADFNYLVNPGFLRPERLAKRRLSGVQPDPLAAILDFQRQLEKRGVELILLPVPVKPMLYGDKLGGPAGVIQNSSWPEFLEQLKAAKVRVVDPAPELSLLRQSGVEPFLATDTHWTPAGAQATARLLAAELGASLRRESGETASITALGDIALMLKLEKPEEVFQPETVTIRQQEYFPDRQSDILLMGDSFTNIFSLGTMNWGVRAGLAELLMAELGRPVDVIARNDAGAYATRQLLANELRRGRDRLAGKKYVIWEFAIRELADGDWKMLSMDLGEAPPVKFLNPESPVTVTATVLNITKVPRPNSAPYKDHVMSVHLGDLNGGGDQALVYFASMRDNRWTPAASLRIGETVKVRLLPWSGAEAEYGSWNRTEFDDEELQLQEPCWGEVLPNQ